MKVTNETWRKNKIGKMVLVHREEVEIPDLEPEADYEAWLKIVDKRLDALESKSERL